MKKNVNVLVKKCNVKKLSSKIGTFVPPIFDRSMGYFRATNSSFATAMQSRSLSPPQSRDRLPERVRGTIISFPPLPEAVGSFSSTAKDGNVAVHSPPYVTTLYRGEVALSASSG